MTSFQATYMFIIMAAYIKGIQVLGNIVEIVCFAVAAFNFVVYFPAFVIWLCTFSNSTK